MGWKLIHCHRVAHVLPSLQAGTSTSGFSINNLGTLDVNRRYLVSGTNPFRADWFRGSATGTGTRGTANGLLMLAHNMYTRSATVDLFADTVSGFTTPTVLVNGDTPAQNGWYFTDFAANTEPYLRIEVNNSTSTFEFGLVSVCQYTDLGNAKIPGSNDSPTTSAVGGGVTGKGSAIFGGLPYGGRGVSYEFDNVAAATYDTIADHYAATYVPQSGGTGAIDGIGMGGGSIPTALVDDSDRPHWGFVSVQARLSSPGYYRLTVSVDPIPIHFVVS